MAQLLAASGAAAEAEARFRAVLYDPALAGGNVRGPALYHYAAFHRDVRRDFVRAAAYFDSAAAVVRAEPAREELVTNQALTGVRRTADVYRAYATLAARVVRLDSLLALGALDEAAFRARVAELEAARLAVWNEEQRRRARERAAAGFGELTAADVLDAGGPGVDAPQAALRPGEGPLTGPAGPTGGAANAGFLNYLNLSLREAARLAFRRVWGDRPLVPNWRRRAAIGGAPVATGPGLDASRGPEGATDNDGPPPLDLTGVPRSPEAQAAARSERAGLRYELGNVLFLSIADPDSAAYWYRLVVEEDVLEPVSFRALYALAEVERARGRDAEAEALYRRVVEADPESAVADQARERLGLPPRAPAAGADSAAAAEAAYTAARARWLAGAFPEALRDLLGVGAAYPAAPAAPRALLAAGALYVDWAGRDGLDLRALPDSLVPAALRPPPPPGADSAAVAAAAARPFGLLDLYAHVARTYPGTPSAERAAALSTALVRRLPAPPEPPPASEGGVASIAAGEPLPDSLAAADSLRADPSPPGPLAADSLAADSLAADALAADTTAALAAGLPAADLPPEEDPLVGTAPVVAGRGGFAWRVASLGNPFAARALVRNLRGRGFRVAVALREAPEGALYDVLVGQFATLAAARQARERIPTTGGRQEQEVVPLTGLTLLDDAALEGALPEQ
jgi:tetratricopeptide (TPR) repeat protein